MSTRHYRKAAAIALVAAVGLSVAACSSSKSSDAGSGHTTITVDCPPLKTDQGGKTLTAWNADVAAFEKANPDITIDTVSVGAQCDNPPDFTARLQGNQQTDIFYGYMTDTDQVLDAGGSEDITKYLNEGDLPQWKSMTDAVKAPFVRDGKVYGVGYAGYTMGLVINTKLFTQAGLDPTQIPNTWDAVRTDAKKIAGLGNGIAGYSDYSAQNTGGWHFTAELYSRGGAMVDSTGKQATFNTPEGAAVLQNLHDMRFTDNSMGSKQLLGWADLLGNAGAGKVGMFIGAPDTIPTIASQFKGDATDWAMGPMPGVSGPGAGTLGGGSGYFFKKGDSAAQIKAGLKWISFEDLTPGRGQFNFVTQKANAQPVGIPEPNPFTQGSDLQIQNDKLKAASATVPIAEFSEYVKNQVPIVVEPPQAQAIYAELDKAMSAVLTQPDANIPALLATATKSVNSLLAAGS